MSLFTFPLLGFSLGGPEIILILCVLILLFGAKKLPELARGIGKSMKEFKKASAENEAAAQEPTEDELKAQLAAAKAELAAAKAKAPADAGRPHGNN
ncbi:MAG: twin-arginine translocase TatA/TatE family subunit [Opitutaceae bacterium]|jgi:sec-independent protein translocase protein TatA|nr:twin-arginine translocase TatA/TatE family subunit [Opitutaceae bacterium]